MKRTFDLHSIVSTKTCAGRDNHGSVRHMKINEFTYQYIKDNPGQTMTVIVQAALANYYSLSEAKKVSRILKNGIETNTVANRGTTNKGAYYFVPLSERS